VTGHTDLADDPLDYDAAAISITAGHTERQQAIAALIITETVTTNGIDYGAGDVVAVYAETIGYRIIDALREHGLAITRRR